VPISVVRPADGWAPSSACGTKSATRASGPPIEAKVSPRKRGNETGLALSLVD
jgi:hypothetical protein